MADDQTTKRGLPSREEQIAIMEDTPRRMEEHVRRWRECHTFREAIRRALPKACERSITAPSDEIRSQSDAV